MIIWTPEFCNFTSMYTNLNTASHLSATGLLLAALAPLDEQLPVEDVDQEVHHDVGQQLLQQHSKVSAATICQVLVLYFFPILFNVGLARG